MYDSTDAAEVELSRQLLEEHIANRKLNLDLLFDAPSAFIIATALQLAIRHPSLENSATQAIRITVDGAIARITDALRSNGMPISAQVLDKGNERENDVPTDATQRLRLRRRFICECGHALELHDPKTGKCDECDCKPLEAGESRRIRDPRNVN